MAYVADGNLYYQNGSNPPLQLTYGGEDRRHLSFSEDGKKVYFVRSVSDEIYSINVDGSEEQALVTNSLLQAFGAGYDTSTTPYQPVPVPHSPFLIFATCYVSDPQIPSRKFNNDLFIFNTDTHEVNKLLSQGQGGFFQVSPDGTMLAMDRQNAIDILGIDGKLIHRKIATYPHSEPFTLGAKMYWIPDSSELILALPINKLYDTSLPPTYAIWRYSPSTNTAVQVNLDPPPMSNGPARVSPDGNWITYINHYEGFFLGNLQEGVAQSYQLGLPHEWSPDSVHFVYEASHPSGTGLGLYLASVNAPPVLIGEGDFLGWLDASKYLYYNYIDKIFLLGEIGKEPMPILVGHTQPLFPGHPESFIFNYQPLNK